MNRSILDQFAWVELFNQQLANGPPKDFVDPSEWRANARQIIFFNPVNHRSMRLTRLGFKYLRECFNLTYYEFSLPEKISLKILLQLERHICYPYFIRNVKKIMIFDERTAIMLQLHDSDLETYLNNIEQDQAG